MVSGALSACVGDSIVIEVTSIEIDTMPSQRYFLVGAELDIDDTLLYVTYENGFSRTVSVAELGEDITITGYDNTTRALNQNVTLTYRDKSVSLIIDVVNEQDILKMTFSPNNGTLGGAPLTAIADKPLNAYISESSLTPTYDGYVFGGWYTSSDNGVTLDKRVDFSTDTFTANTVFYAKWQVAVIFNLATYTQDNVYQIAASYTAYVDKGGSLSEADFNAYVDNRLVFKDKTGYQRAFKESDVTVAGMNRDDVIKLADASYGAGYSNITETKTVYCVYVPELIKLYFDFNGASSTWDPNMGFSGLKMDEEGRYYDEISYGTKYIFGDPMKTASVGTDSGDQDYVFRFGGWYTSESYTEDTKVNTTKVTGGYSSLLYATDAITASTTFYARWRWELLLYSGVSGALLEPMETLTFDEGQMVYYSDLPDTPVTFLTSNSDTPYTYDRAKYTSWWAFQENQYSDGTSSNFTEYEYALDPATPYGLGKFLSDRLVGNVAVVYANYYRIPYYVTFNTYTAAEQRDPTIINGDVKYYGDTLSAYSGANGDQALFEGWYLDKYLQQPLVPYETTVKGVHYGRSAVYVTNGEGLIILNSQAYYALDGNVYSSNPKYLTDETKADYVVGSWSEDDRFTVNQAKYYAVGNAVYMLKPNDDGAVAGEIIVGEETYIPKADFDANKAYNSSSYAIMDLHAAYNVSIKFSIAAEYTGSEAFNKSEAASLVARKEYYSDGVYYANIESKTPAVPAIEGKDGYWLKGNTFGVVDTDVYDHTTLLPISYPEFDKIARDESFAAHYITKQYNVKFILTNQKDTEDFNTVYLAYQEELEALEITTKVTYNQKASFYQADMVLTEGDTTIGIVEWMIEGWYTEADYITKFDFDNTAIMTDYTLYAKWARIGTVGLGYTTIADNTYAVSSFDQTAFEAKYGTGAKPIRLVVPDYYEGKLVTQINASVFKNNATLQEIFVTHNVTQIGAEAFFNATNLATIHTFNTNVQLASDVFDGTAWYRTSKANATNGMIIFNDNQLYEYVGSDAHLEISEESNIKIIGYGAFYKNSSLLTIRISNQVTAIRGYAFAECINLQSIDFVASDRYYSSQLALNSIGINAFMHLESLVRITLHGDNYTTVDGVLYRRENGLSVELMLYPTNKSGDILVLPKSLASIGEQAFYSNNNKIGIKVLVFDSITAPTLGMGENAFTYLPYLTYILVPNSPTYRGEGEYADSSWLNIYYNAKDMFRNNSIEIEYISTGIALTNTPSKTTFVYGDQADAYVPTTANAGTFVGWFVDNGLTVRWLGSLDNWVEVWDVLTTSWDADGYTTDTLKVYAKWEMALNTGSTNAGTVYAIGGRPIEDKNIVIIIDGVKYYAQYDATGAVTFDDVAPIGQFAVDATAKTLTRTLADGSTEVYTYGQKAVVINDKKSYITVTNTDYNLTVQTTKHYLTANGGIVVFDGTAPIGSWSISGTTLTRNVNGAIIQYTLLDNYISFVLDGTVYYARATGGAVDATLGNIVFEGTAPAGIFNINANNELKRTLDGTESTIIYNRGYYQLSMDNVSFVEEAPMGTWLIDSANSKIIRVIGESIAEFGYTAGSTIVLTLEVVEISGNNTAGWWSIDRANNTITLTTTAGQTTYVYAEEPVLLSADGTRVGNIDLYSYLKSIVDRQENTEVGYTTAWFYLDGERVTDNYVNLNMLTMGGNVSIDRRVNVYTVTYQYFDYNTNTTVVYEVTNAEHFSMLLRPESPQHDKIGDVEIVFGGWYDVATGNRWQDNATVTGNLVLEAHWTVAITTMYCYDSDDINEAKMGSEILVLYNSPMTKPQADHKPGYTYNWYLEDGSEFEFSQDITQNYILYAKYTKIEYTVSFVSELKGTVAPASQKVEYGEKANYVVATSGADAENGYVFVGWYLDKEYKNAFGFSTPITSSITVYAYWVYTTTTMLDYNKLTSSGSYSVMGNTITDSVVYIPEKYYKSVDSYYVYKAQDFSGEVVGNYELGNNAITIAELQANTGVSVLYKDTDGNLCTGVSLAPSTRIGTYTTSGNVMTIVINQAGFSWTYYIDMEHSYPQIVAIENTSVTNIADNGFENNSNITHIVISKNVREIGTNAFKGMPNLARFTVLSDGNNYYDKDGNALVNCNGSFASIDGVLYAISQHASVPYSDGYKVSIDRLVKMPAQMQLETYTIENLKFSVSNGEIIRDDAGLYIDGYAFEQLVYINNIYIKDVVTRPTIGGSVFSGVKTELKIFVHSKESFIYDSNGGETNWYEWKDYLYPNEVIITYIDTLTGEELFTNTVDVFSTAIDQAYEEIRDYQGKTWTFGGWTTSADMVKLFDFTMPLENNVTLYARWVISASSGLQYEKIVYSNQDAYMVTVPESINKDIIIPNFYKGLPVRKLGHVKNTNIESLYIPATVMDIPETSLLNLANLKTITVDDNSLYFRVIDGVLFSYDGEDLILYPAKLDSDSTEYTVPEGTVRVKRGAFYATSLTKITFAESVTSLGQALFSNTKYLERIILLGLTPPTLRANPLVGASSTLLILVPGVTDGVSIVERYKSAWSTMVEKEALDNIYGKTVYLRLLVEENGAWTVYGSPSAEYASPVGSQGNAPTAPDKVFIGWYTTQYIGGELWDFVNTKLYEDTNLYARWNMATDSQYLSYSNGKVTLNRETAGALELEKIVIASHYVYDNITYEVESIDEGAFKDMTKLKSVVIPSTVTNIFAEAFMGCTSLVDVKLPDGMLSIGAHAFDGCISLETITIPSAISTIDNYLFNGCVSLKSVVFLGEPTIIGEYAFSGCIALSNIDIKSAVESIGNYAFSNMDSLTTISLPATLTHIGNYVFKDDVRLESVSFAPGITLDNDLGVGLFYNCVKLNNVVLPRGLTSIALMAFYGAKSLTEITIYNTITTIAGEAFYRCEALERVIIEDGSMLKTINQRAFAYCYSLKQIEFKTETRMTFEQNVFTGCTALEQVILHSKYVAILNGTGITEKFLYGADNATLYVDSALVVNYRNEVEIYKDRVKPYYSTVEYWIDLNTKYQYKENNEVKHHKYQNLTDNLISDSNVLAESPILVNNETWGWNKSGLEFGGWGYYKNPTDTTLSLFNFATVIVGEEGIKLYAIWIVDGTDGLAYSITYDGTIQVSKGNLSTETDIIISNYYKYNNQYLPVTSIDSGLIDGTSAVTVRIPETITKIADDAFVGCGTLKKFIVDSANTAYMVEEDVLYTHNKSKIVCFPPSKGEEIGGITYTIPAVTTTITQYTFDNAKYIEQFYSSSVSFTTKNYVLYSQDGSKLIAYPALLGESSYTLPSTVETIYVNAFSLSPSSSLATILVEEGNANYFADEDGVLYRRITDTTAELVRFPVAQFGDSTGKYTIDKNMVTRISTNAFRYARELNAVVIDKATPITIGDDVFADTAKNLYILVPTDNVYNYKVAPAWVEYSSNILPISSVITFYPNNGDDTITITVNTLDPFPAYPYSEPILPWSTSTGWYYLDQDEIPVMVELGSSDYLVYGSVTLTKDWMVEADTSNLFFEQYANGYIVSNRSLTTAENGNRILIIPSFYNGKPVVGIKADGFRVTASDQSMLYLRTVVIPDTVTFIGDNAFTGCINLLDMVLLGLNPPTIDKSILTDWRNDVAENMGVSGPRMRFFVRRDAITNYEKDTNLSNVFIRTFSMRVNVLDEEGNVVESHALYALYDSANIINPVPTDRPKEGYDLKWYYINSSDKQEYEYTQGGQPLDVTAIRDLSRQEFSLNIYAKYTPKTITLTFISTEAGATLTGDTTISALTGSEITPPTATLEGKTFVGWVDQATGNTVDLTLGMPTRDMTLVAQWEETV